MRIIVLSLYDPWDCSTLFAFLALELYALVLLWCFAFSEFEDPNRQEILSHFTKHQIIFRGCMHARCGNVARRLKQDPTTPEWQDVDLPRTCVRHCSENFQSLENQNEQSAKSGMCSGVLPFDTLNFKVFPVCNLHSSYIHVHRVCVCEAWLTSDLTFDDFVAQEDKRKYNPSTSPFTCGEGFCKANIELVSLSDKISHCCAWLMTDDMSKSSLWSECLNSVLRSVLVLCLAFLVTHELPCGALFQERTRLLASWLWNQFIWTKFLLQLVAGPHHIHEGGRVRQLHAPRLRSHGGSLPFPLQRRLQNHSRRARQRELCLSVSSQIARPDAFSQIFAQKQSSARIEIRTFVLLCQRSGVFTLSYKPTYTKSVQAYLPDNQCLKILACSTVLWNWASVIAIIRFGFQTSN